MWVALCVRTLHTFFTFLSLGESWLVLTGNTHAIILYNFFCCSDWWCCSNCGVYTVLGEFRMIASCRGTCRSRYVKMLPWACIRTTHPPKKKKKKKKKKRFWIITCTTIWVCYHYCSVFCSFTHLTKTHITTKI